ncbi:hypothetical protein [Streptacidiphilus monticola]|uniref:Secreted protein n=1 Tax=Streptacidiphilus monticola TaxID=2161674 RepID=A0ABW1GAM4_9ACTN
MGTAAVVGPAPAATAATHHGVSGCFSWSWDDSGWATTTVYFHNRCRTRHQIEISWDGNAYADMRVNVAPDGKGSRWTTSDGVTAVHDNGPL